jgi:hypothetical protein
LESEGKRGRSMSQLDGDVRVGIIIRHRAKPGCGLYSISQGLLEG